MNSSDHNLPFLGRIIIQSTFTKKVFLFVLDNQCVGILPVYSTELLCVKFEFEFESFTFEGKAGRGWGACAGETWIGEIKLGLKT